MADDDEIDLNALSDEDLTAQMHDDLYDGLADEIEEGTNILLSRGWTPTRCSTTHSSSMRSSASTSWAFSSFPGAPRCRRDRHGVLAAHVETGAEPIGKVVIGAER